jgi:transcription elongation factor GreA
MHTKLDVVEIGSTVTYTEQVTGHHRTIQIVASRYADPAHGLLSDRSPIGHALLGHRAGDVVRFVIPRGERQLQIDRVL